MARLKRKIDDYLVEWKKEKDHLPLIIKGARQIGKTNAIRNFGEKNYKVYIEINFALQPQFLNIFEQGFEVDTILKNISLKLPNIEIIPTETLIFLMRCKNVQVLQHHLKHSIWIKDLMLYALVH